jgi:hypothetical protein
MLLTCLYTPKLTFVAQTTDPVSRNVNSSTASLTLWEVFALFRANVRMIDTVRRATLFRLLLESIISTESWEHLDEKLASLALPVDSVEREYS